MNCVQSVIPALLALSFVCPASHLSSADVPLGSQQPQPAAQRSADAPGGDYTAHVAFVRQHGQKPVDYILSLFDTYDIVVLCERMHPEATQWQLIFDVVRDPRFAQKVGHIFTEYNSVSAQADLDDLMRRPGLTQQEVDRRVRLLVRRCTVYPLVDLGNFYEFHRKLYALNQASPSGRRTSLHYCDVPWDWAGMTEEKYKELLNTALRERDKTMADRIIASFNAIRAAGEGRKKALVIMNFRHALNHTDHGNGRRVFNAAGYLMEAFPGRVANVLLHTVNLGADRLLQDGKWDVAFNRLGNRPAGFSLAGSPFGRDSFDFWDMALAERYQYEQMFTGYVFDGPLTAHRVINGFPGILDGFEEEVLERSKSLGADYYRRMKDELLPRMKATPVREGPAAYGEQAAKSVEEWLSGTHSARVRATAKRYAAYSGRYQVTPQIVLAVSVSQGRLLALLEGRGSQFELTPDEGDKFWVMKDRGVFVVFQRDADGQVTGVLMHEREDRVGPRIK